MKNAAQWIQDNILISLLILVAILFFLYQMKWLGNNTTFFSNERVNVCTCGDGKVHPSMKAGPNCDNACAGLI